MAVIFFSSLAAVIIGISQFQYIFYLLRNHLILNKTTWFISAIVMVLSATSYFDVVKSGNPIIATSSIITAICFIFIFFYALLRGKYAPFSRLDIILLIIASIGIVAWKITNNASTANVVFETTLLVSFIPTATGLIRGSLKEKAAPWFVGVLAGVFSTIAVLSAFGTENPVALVAPIIGMLINGTIGILAFLQNQKILPLPK